MWRILKKIIAVSFTAFAGVALLSGNAAISSSPSLIFKIVASFPWATLTIWLLEDSLGGNALIPAAGVAINLLIVWWWALKGNAAPKLM